MTSIKIIREREEESSKNVEQHKLLSAFHSLLQQNYDTLGYRIVDFSIEETHSVLKAKPSSHREGSPEIFVYALPGASASVDLNSIVKEDAKNSASTPLTVIVTGEGTGDIASSSDIVLELSGDGTTLKLRSGEILNTPLEPVFLDGVAVIISNYPHPYHIALDPLIKFRFLSLNHSRNGKFSLVSILHATSDQAYILSVNQERESIRADLHELLTDMDKAGIITARGNEIYFPKNSGKLEKSIIRRYWDYVEKIGKRTLFDFEAPF